MAACWRSLADAKKHPALVCTRWQIYHTAIRAPAGALPTRPTNTASACALACLHADGVRHVLHGSRHASEELRVQRVGGPHPQQRSTQGKPL